MVEGSRGRLASRTCLLLLLLGGVARGQDVRQEVRHEPPRITRPPQLLRFQAADYPEAARREGISGTVELLITVGADGKVTEVSILRAPHPALAEAARRAALAFRFSPAEIDGKPGPVRIRYGYRFTLETRFTPRLPAWMEDRRLLASGTDVLVGRVREQGTRAPLGALAVAVTEAGQETRTDERGNFAFRSIPPGRYHVEVISPEHHRESVQVTLRAGEQTRIEFFLRRTVENPYETVVRGQRRKTVVSRVSLRQRELTTVPGTMGDPLRVIESLPGVARVPYVGGALLIRGAAPADSGVFLDGTPIPILYHFLGGPSVLHPDFLDRIDYYPGNADVRYGRLTAGVVDVSTRKATPAWSGALDVNLLNASLFLKAPVSRKVSLEGAVRRSYIEAVLPPILRLTDRKATTVVPVYYDYQLRCDVDLAGDDRLYLLAFGSDDRLAIASNEPDSAAKISIRTHVGFHRLLGEWRARIGERLTSRLTPTVGVNQVTADVGEASVDLLTVNGLLREDLEWRWSHWGTLRFGLDATVELDRFDTMVPLPTDYRNPGSGEEYGAGHQVSLTGDVHPVRVDQVVFALGLYADNIFHVGKRLQLVPGVRFELFRYSNRLQLAVDPRLTIRFAIRPWTTLKAAAGLYSQQPSPNEVNDTFGNPRLTPKHAAHFSAGIEQRLLPSFSVDAQLYLIRRYNVPIPTDEVREVDGSLVPLRFSNQGDGLSYGLELILRHEMTRRFYGWLAYTLSRSLENDGPGGPYIPFAFDQTHILTLVASLRLGAGWEVGGRFRLVSGRPETPVLGGIFDSDLDLYRRILGPRRSARQPLFHQLDLRVEKTWFFKLWRFSAYLDVQNVYNAENPEATLWDYRFRQSGHLRGLPVMPAIGVKAAF